MGLDLDAELGDLPHLLVAEHRLLGLRLGSARRVNVPPSAPPRRSPSPCGGLPASRSSGRPWRRRSGPGETEPETTASPRPKAPSITSRSRRPAGRVDREHHPGAGGSIWRWTTTAMSMSAWPKPRFGRGSRSVRAPNREDQQRRTRVSTESAPLTLRKRLVHPGEGGRGGVLGGRRGANRYRRARVAFAEARGRRRGSPSPSQSGSGSDSTSDRASSATRSSAAGVLDVDRFEPAGDPLPQPPAVAEGRVGGGPDHEPGRDGQARGGQLAEVGALASGEADVARGPAARSRPLPRSATIMAAARRARGTARR